MPWSEIVLAAVEDQESEAEGGTGALIQAITALRAAME